jgi:serine/threonine protein kinase
MENMETELEALENVFGDASAEPIKLSYGLLRYITDNFSNEIGRGGFGVVYMVWFLLNCLANSKFSPYLPHWSEMLVHILIPSVKQGNIEKGKVAVKKLSTTNALPDNQFLDEITCLKDMNHRNIVRFLGYCSDTEGEVIELNGKFIMKEIATYLLCFEYVPNGDIRHYIQQGMEGFSPSALTISKYILIFFLFISIVYQ